MKEKKFNLILDVARKRFYHYGIKKTTMGEIANDAGMAVGTLYLYFKDKDAIIEGCVDQFILKHAEEEKTILEAKSPAGKKLTKYMVARFRASQQTRTSATHAAEMTRRVLTLRPNRINEEAEQMFRVISTILMEGCQSKEMAISDIEDSVMVFLYATSWFFPLATDEFRKEPDEKDLIKVINWFIKKWKNTN